MPFFSDYGYYHHGSSVPFSSQYYSQLLPYPGSNSSRPGGILLSSSSSRIQPRNYSVEQTLRAIKRGGPAAAAVRQQYARPVHVNTSEIDVTSPRRPPPRKPTSATGTPITDGGGGDGGNNIGGGGIQRGRTVIRLHTKNKRTEKPVVATVSEDGPEVIRTVVTDPPPESPAMPVLPEEGLAKKGTIKRHTSVGVKVPVTDDRRPSVTDQILREQEALFDTMIMEEMEGGQRERRKSYPVDTDDGKKQLLKHNKDARKKSAASVLVFGGGELPALAGGTEKPVTKKTAGTNWKLNYDVIVEESVGNEPVSFTFKLNKTKDDDGGKNGGDDNGKLDANRNVESHVDSNHLMNTANDAKTHAKTVVGGGNNNNRANNIVDNGDGNSDVVCMSAVVAKKLVKKKVIVKKKVVKKKENDEKQQPEPQKLQLQQPPVKSKRTKKEPSAKKKPTVSSPPKPTPSPAKPKKKGAKTEAAAAASASASAVVTPFIRTSFGKTFISPAQVSSVKSKFETAKPKVKRETPPTPPPPPDSSSSEDGESDDDDQSSLDSGDSGTSSGSSSSSYYDSDDYGDKRIACSVSSFDSGLPSSPVPAPDPIG